FPCPFGRSAQLVALHDPGPARAVLLAGGTLMRRKPPTREERGDSPMSASVVPSLKPLFHAEVEVGPIETVARLQAGARRVIPITGGRVTPADADGVFRGRILPIGEDWQWARADGTLELVAHYVLELETGDRIEVLA